MERAFLPPHRDPSGRFVTGNSGRPRGPNRVNRTLREAIVMAAEELGSDGRGRGDLIGFLRMLIKRDLKSFVGLMGRCMPLDLHTKAEEPVTYRSVEEVEAELARRGITPDYMLVMAESAARRAKANSGNGSLNGGGGQS